MPDTLSQNQTNHMRAHCTVELTTEVLFFARDLGNLVHVFIHLFIFIYFKYNPLKQKEKN